MDAIDNLRTRFERRGLEHSFILQEDNDGSHGHGKPGLCTTIKAERNIQTIVYPLLLPDVNPQEAVWSILKQRVKKRV
jgi:hypothetical protein